MNSRQHKRARDRRHDTRRGSARQRGYTHEWEQARALFLTERPLCRKCEAKQPPKLVAAKIVDHIKPHKGDPVLFWNRDNWQPLCVPCHSSAKQSEERGRAAVGVNGWPVNSVS